MVKLGRGGHLSAVHLVPVTSKHHHWRPIKLTRDRITVNIFPRDLDWGQNGPVTPHLGGAGGAAISSGGHCGGVTRSPERQQRLTNLVMNINYYRNIVKAWSKSKPLSKQAPNN